MSAARLAPGPGLRFRNMTEADLAAVMDIERRGYRHPWSAGIMRDCVRSGYCCRVLEDEHGIVGYGILSVAAGEAHILNLCVDPELHNRGLGRRILRHLLELARRLGARRAYLEVRPSNPAAIHLYESEGFNQVGERRGYYPNGFGRPREDALVMAIELEPDTPPA